MNIRVSDLRKVLSELTDDESVYLSTNPGGSELILVVNGRPDHLMYTVHVEGVNLPPTKRITSEETL